MKKKNKLLGVIHNKDCISFMKKHIPDNKIDLVVTSPPYNVGIDYDSYNDSRPFKEYLHWCKRWLSEIYRILKPDGRIALNVLIETEVDKKRVSPYAEFYSLFKEVGIKNKGLALWTDNNKTKLTAWGSYLSASAPYMYCPYEVIMIGYKKQWKKIKKGTSTIKKEDFIEGCSGIWNISPILPITKANFPKRLPELCIQLFSYKNDIVYDPFAGAGTTCVVAEQLYRRWLGTEVSKEYCKKANTIIKLERQLSNLRGLNLFQKES